MMLKFLQICGVNAGGYNWPHNSWIAEYLLVKNPLKALLAIYLCLPVTKYSRDGSILQWICWRIWEKEEEHKDNMTVSCLMICPQMEFQPVFE